MTLQIGDSAVTCSDSADWCFCSDSADGKVVTLQIEAGAQLTSTSYDWRYTLSDFDTLSDAVCALREIRNHLLRKILNHLRCLLESQGLLTLVRTAD